jgi:hypothetical protein
MCVCCCVALAARGVRLSVETPATPPSPQLVEPPTQPAKWDATERPTARSRGGDSLQEQRQTWRGGLEHIEKEKDSLTAASGCWQAATAECSETGLQQQPRYQMEER